MSLWSVLIWSSLVDTQALNLGFYANEGFNDPVAAKTWRTHTLLWMRDFSPNQRDKWSWPNDSLRPTAGQGRKETGVVTKTEIKCWHESYSEPLIPSEKIFPSNDSCQQTLANKIISSQIVAINLLSFRFALLMQFISFFAVRQIWCHKV